MPFYQYSCRSCDQKFEKRLQMSRAGEKQVCPSCGSHETRKRISAFAVGGVAKGTAPAFQPASGSPFS